MTEEVAIRIAEALEGIDGTLDLIAVLAICWLVSFWFTFLLYITKS